MSNNIRNIIIVFVVVVLAFILGLSKDSQISSSVQSSILEHVRDEKVIRVGYAAYPPYVIKDLKTGELSGYYIDIMGEMADRAGVEIDWVETTWQTYISDLQTGKFDVINDPMYATIPRWKEVSFTEPLGYFSGVAGVTQKEDDRFLTIMDLNNSDVVIAVPQGWTSEEYAKKHLPLATLKVFPGETASLAITDAVTGNADVALVDGVSVQQYIEQNFDKDAKSLFLDNPPAITPAAWAVRKGDYEWLNFLNGAIRSMWVDGTMQNFAKKYKLYSYEIETNFIQQ